MDKKKLADMIDGIDDKYLRESEDTDINTETGNKVAIFAIVAVSAVVLIVGIALKMSRINQENNSDNIALATTSAIDGIMDKAEFVATQDNIDLNNIKGKNINDVIAAWGEPNDKVRGGYVWKVDYLDETRFIYIQTVDDVVEYCEHSVPMYVTVVDKNEDFGFISRNKELIDDKGLSFISDKDVFENQTLLRNGMTYEFQSNGMILDCYPGRITIPYSIKEIGEAEKEDYDRLQKEYGKYCLANFGCNYFGSYNTAEVVFRSLASSHFGDAFSNKQDTCIISDEEFKLSVGENLNIYIEHPEYKYIYNESNNYGFTNVYLNSEFEKINDMMGDNCKVFAIKGNSKVRILVAKGQVYINTGDISFGVYNVNNSGISQYDSEYWEFEEVEKIEQEANYESMIENDGLALCEWNTQDAVYENGIWSKKYFRPMISREKICAYKNPDKNSEKIYFDEDSIIYFDKTDRKEWIHITDNNNEGWIYFKNDQVEIKIEIDNQKYLSVLEAFVCCVQGDFTMGNSSWFSVPDSFIAENIPEGREYTVLWYDNYKELVEYLDLHSDVITENVCTKLKEHAYLFKDFGSMYDGKYKKVIFFILVYKGNESISEVNWIKEGEKMYGFAETGDKGVSSGIQLGITNHIVADTNIIIAK